VVHAKSPERAGVTAAAVPRQVRAAYGLAWARLVVHAGPAAAAAICSTLEVSSLP
jgi:hypothetical protein